MSTSAPSAVRQRSRNGLAGMGSTAKQPISSIEVLVIAPARVCVSSVPARGGMTWPSREFPVTSISSVIRAEVKVRARIEAVS